MLIWHLIMRAYSVLDSTMGSSNNMTLFLALSTTKVCTKEFSKYCWFLAARRHVNRMCVYINKPIIESGTAGYLGQVEPLIYAGRTSEGPQAPCFECTPRANDRRTYPTCTIRNTPSEPVHCVVWAKFLFKLALFLITKIHTWLGSLHIFFCISVNFLARQIQKTRKFLPIWTIQKHRIPKTIRVVKSPKRTTLYGQEPLLLATNLWAPKSLSLWDYSTETSQHCWACAACGWTIQVDVNRVRWMWARWRRPELIRVRAFVRTSITSYPIVMGSTYFNVDWLFRSRR